MPKNSNEQSHVQPITVHKTCQREIRRCIYCIDELQKITDITSKDMRAHIIGSHKKTLIKLDIYQNFKCTEGRNYLKTQKFQQTLEKISQTSKLISKQIRKKQSIFGNGELVNVSDAVDTNLLAFAEEMDNQLFNPQMLQNQVVVGEIQIQNQKYQQENNQLTAQIQSLESINRHLIQFSKLIQSNKKTKELILSFAENDQQDPNKIKKIIQQSKIEMETIEFSVSGITQKMRFLSEKYREDTMTKQFMIASFIQKCLDQLVEINEECFKYIDQLQYGYQQNISKVMMKENPMNFQQIFREKIQEDHQRNLVHDKYVESLMELEKLKKSEPFIDHKLPQIAINGDVFDKNFLKTIGEKQQQLRGTKFGVVEMDYPWAIDFVRQDGKQFLPYVTQKTSKLYDLEIENLQDNGYLFMWTVGQKFTDAVAFMLFKGYKIVDSVAWVKLGKFSNYKNGQGYHLRHNKEICLVGLKGKVPDGVNSFTVSDLIQSIPGKHSQKPVEIKQLIEKLYPNGHYCELFGRKNNLRDGWVTIGNEL